MKRVVGFIVSILVLLGLVSAAFAAGVYVQFTYPAITSAYGLKEPVSTLGEQVEEVERLIDRQSLEPSDDESQSASAINGLLESLGDPYAIYFNPEHYAYFNEDANGEFYGIGVTISQREEAVYVVNVLKDTPAEKAGIRPADEVVSINGETRDRWDVDEVVKLIRGPEGSQVTVDMYRPSEETTLSFEITRAKIVVPNFEARMEGDDVGYIRLYSFNQHSAADVAGAIEDLKSKGAKSYVLDLRDNPGGLLSSAVEVSSLFVEDGVIVRVDQRNVPEEEHRAQGGAVTDAPVVVLVNENSASASEIVAGALQDYDRAQIVGDTTFGKGSVQTVEPLTFGGAVKFTIAHYLTPKGRTIDGVGVEPDVKVAMELEKQLEPKTDVQLQRAIKEARAEN